MDRFSIGDYNNLLAQKIGLVEIVEKINLNTCHLKISSYIWTVNEFSVKHLIMGDNSS